MSDDVIRFADKKQLETFSLLGHNIGAKTAMTLACRYPDRVDGLISIDTAPKNFNNDKDTIKKTINSITKIKNLNIEGKTRKTALDVIQKEFSDPGIANFIASNLVYDEDSDNKYVKWCINLDAILKNIHNLVGFEDEELKPYLKPTMFINGSLSVKLENHTYTHLFPDSYIEIIEGAGHYVHTDKPKTTVELVGKFLNSLSKL